MIETTRWLNFYLTENPEVQQSNNMNMRINVDDIPEGKSSRVVSGGINKYSIGNSVVSRGVCAKYHEWYSRIYEIITNPKAVSSETSWACFYSEKPLKAIPFPVFFVYTTMHGNSNFYMTCISYLAENSNPVTFLKFLSLYHNNCSDRNHDCIKIWVI